MGPAWFVIARMYLTFGFAAVTSLPKNPAQTLFQTTVLAIASVRTFLIYASVMFSKLYGSLKRLRGEFSDAARLQKTTSTPPLGSGSATQLFLKF